jgi:hypothetical protein
MKIAAVMLPSLTAVIEAVHGLEPISIQISISGGLWLLAAVWLLTAPRSS